MKVKKLFASFLCLMCAAFAAETAFAEDGGMPVTLTVNGKAISARLDDSSAGRSLAAQLPLTVRLNDSGNDFCGGSLNIDYGSEDVKSGYKNGELAYWTPAKNFVIFVSGEENSGTTGDLVKLGNILEPLSVLDSLSGTADVTIARAEGRRPAEARSMRLKIAAGGRELAAVLEDNTASRAFAAMLPLTLPMENLYEREMCHRFGAGALPDGETRSDGYAVGDIAYWPPRGSLVILYAQNGERFERVHLGHIDGGVEIFRSMGDVDVTFEILR